MLLVMVGGVEDDGGGCDGRTTGDIAAYENIAYQGQSEV